MRRVAIKDEFKEYRQKPTLNASLEAHRSTCECFIDCQGKAG